jgi:succinyl-CoA synthetase beta subunit
MKIHEHQARDLLARYGIPVPPGIVVNNGAEAAKAFERLAAEHGAKLAVVKAQVHAGGRGKGGGVKLVRTADEARQSAAKILGSPLVTPQTGPEGVTVEKVLVSVAVDIEHEYYLGIAVDRASARPVLIASREGGVEIEQVAASNPDAILREPIDAALRLQDHQARRITFRLGLSGKPAAQAARIMCRLADLLFETDASLAEINPLVLTPLEDDAPEGQIMAIDAKINFDDNALFRQEKIRALADPAEIDPAELRAGSHGLSYVKLDGNIGCLVNGAGLAMATMDLIKIHGGDPANFLDVGGSATEEAVTEAFRIILDDPNVKGVLVNIFGGIAKCDTIARAIVAAANQVGFEVPLVVRLEGTNVEKARPILNEARGQIPTMQIGDDLTDAAKMIIEAAGVGAAH